jgi:BirA family transcriptional regulator, biotin operon repressor / biotin---[acetyl-CoA-carboxylase] ligase
MSDLAPERVRPWLRGAFGEPYLYAVETASTQDVLRDSEHPHGAVAVAEHQTAGRGRSGRRWEDEPATALLFSVLLEPPAGALLPQLSLVAGIAVAVSLERVATVPTLVKWPNDVLVDREKVAGILLEASGGRVVCGIGINVDQDRGELPHETRAPATSLRLAAGRRFDRGVLLAAVLEELERRYAAWLEHGLAALADELERRNALDGAVVLVDGRRGTAGAIAPDGRLTVELNDGEMLLVESGEVEITGVSGFSRTPGFRP